MKQSVSPARQSNIELLRIIAMVMVMTFHSDFMANLETIKVLLHRDAPAAWFMCFMQCSVVICVNLFVLVSGYFTIRTSLRRLLKFMYMCLFWGLGITLGLLAANKLFASGPGVTWRMVLDMLVPGAGYWFAKSYVCLMIFAPALNLLIRKLPGSGLLTFAVGLALFQFVGNTLTETYDDVFHGGFSVYSFFGLYLIGASIGRFRSRITLSPAVSLGAYFILTVIATLLVINALPTLTWFLSWHIRYNSLLVILSSLFFFLAFIRFRFTSRTVNFFAASAFAVYLLHEHPLMQPYYKMLFQYMWNNYPWWYYPAFQAVVFAAIYLVATLIDQIRIWSWRLIDSHVDFERLLHRRIEPAILKAAARIFSPALSKKL